MNSIIIKLIIDWLHWFELITYSWKIKIVLLCRFPIRRLRLWHHRVCDVTKFQRVFLATYCIYNGYNFTAAVFILNLILKLTQTSKMSMKPLYWKSMKSILDLASSYSIVFFVEKRGRSIHVEVVSWKWQKLMKNTDRNPHPPQTVVVLEPSLCIGITALSGGPGV